MARLQQTTNSRSGKLLIVYSRYFKLIISLNITLSFFVFLSAKNMLIENPYGVLPMLIFFKLIGYGSSVMAELVFQPERRIFFYNLRLSYTRIFFCMFLFDSLIFLTIISVWMFLLN